MHTRSIERILVATDGSADSTAATEFAALLASSRLVRVTLLHVAPAVDFPLGTTQLGEVLPEPGPEDDIGIVRAVWEGSQAILDNGINLLQRTGVAAEGMVREGEAAGEILGLLEDDPFDLVILGRRGAGNSEEEVGRTAMAVVKGARSPVLVVGARSEGE